MEVFAKAAFVGIVCADKLGPLANPYTRAAAAIGNSSSSWCKMWTAIVAVAVLRSRVVSGKSFGSVKPYKYF